jgi:hypothetical protein
MLRCPHCGENGLRFFEKAFSSLSAPARCWECKGLASPNFWLTLVGHALCQLLFWVSAGFALYYHSWLPVAAFGVFLVFGIVAAPFVPATKTSARAATRFRFARWIFIAGFIVFGVVSIISQNEF